MTDNQILLEVLKEVKSLRETVNQIHAYYKPSPTVKKKTKKELFEEKVQLKMLEIEARTLARG